MLYSYIGSDRHELTIKENDIVEILEEMSGWYRGKVVKEGEETSYYGVFPASYVLLTNDEVLPKSELFKRKLKLYVFIFEYLCYQDFRELKIELNSKIYFESYYY